MILRSFRRSVRTKLVVSSIVPAVLAASSAMAAAGLFIRDQLRDQARAELLAEAGIIAANAAASLQFLDPVDAREVLSGLRGDPGIVSATIYDGDGVPFAQYAPPGQLTSVPVQAPELEESVFRDGLLVSSVEVSAPESGESLGWVVLVSDNRALRGLLRRITWGSLLAVLSAILMAMWLALRLQRSVLTPISVLSDTARQVREGKNYGIRVPDPSEDEIGRLGTAVNEMLGQIQQRDELLRERETYFRSLIEQSSDIITVVGPEDTIRYQSPSVKTVLGLDPDSQAGRSPWDAVHPDDRTTVREHFRGEGSPGTVTFRAIHADGSVRVLEAVGSVRTDEEGRKLRITSARDVTERMRGEAERERLSAQLVQAQKMEAVGQLTGGIAHDFNNLLTVVMGNLEMIRGGMTDPGHREEHLTDAIRAAERGAELTRGLLAFSRKQELRPRRVDPHDLVQSVQRLLTRVLDETITLSFDLDSELWPCEVDPGQLENAVLNLSINARDAMPGGGTLTLRCRNRVLAEQRGQVPPGHWVTLTVSDTGCGIPSDLVERVFEPFFTTKEVGKGSGLGLSMVYGFVRQSGGRVTLESELGTGTEITIWLPRLRLEGDRVEDPEASPQPPTGGGRRVLIVEDHPPVRRLAAAFLSSLDYETVECGTAQEAVDRLNEQADFDVVLSDIVLPGGMSGAELAEWAGERHGGLPFVLMSGHPRDALGTLNPETPFVQKPFTRIALAEALHTALARVSPPVEAVDDRSG